MLVALAPPSVVAAATAAAAAVASARSSSSGTAGVPERAGSVSAYVNPRVSSVAVSQAVPVAVSSLAVSSFAPVVGLSGLSGSRSAGTAAVEGIVYGPPAVSGTAASPPRVVQPAVTVAVSGTASSPPRVVQPAVTLAAPSSPLPPQPPPPRTDLDTTAPLTVSVVADVVGGVRVPTARKLASSRGEISLTTASDAEARIASGIAAPTPMAASPAPTAPVVPASVSRTSEAVKPGSARPRRGELDSSPAPPLVVTVATTGEAVRLAPPQESPRSPDLSATRRATRARRPPASLQVRAAVSCRHMLRNFW